jgi:hypothetical protein
VGFFIVKTTNKTYPEKANRLIVILALVSFFLAPLPVRSTIVVEMDVKTMARNSCAVVIGDLLEIQKEWIPSPVSGGEPVVQATLMIKVRKVFKSCSGIKKGDVIPVLRPGGSIGDSGTIIIGSPTFNSGTRLLLFLAQTPDGRFIITGLSQGKFRILKDEATGKEEAVQDKAARTLTFVNMQTGQMSEEKSTPDRMDVEDISKELENPS